MAGSDLMDLIKRGGCRLRWMMAMMVEWWDLRVGRMDDEIKGWWYRSSGLEAI